MSAQTKHTPGPWKICYDGQIDGPNGELVCSLSWESFKEFNDSAENKANATLIAEAGTVAHETGLTPRQLADQWKKSSESLRNLAASAFDEIALTPRQRVYLLEVLEHIRGIALVLIDAAR